MRATEEKIKADVPGSATGENIEVDEWSDIKFETIDLT